MFEAYLDIETTGLSSFYNYITVIGIYLVNGRRTKVVQLVDKEVTRQNLLANMEDVHTIYTYNGKRFDLPFIKLLPRCRPQRTLRAPRPDVRLLALQPPGRLQSGGAAAGHSPQT